MKHIWQLQDAKNKFSQVVAEAMHQGPQIITRHGVQVVVVISYDDYTRLQKQETDLIEFFQSSPFSKVELDLGRDQSLPRDVAL